MPAKSGYAAGLFEGEGSLTMGGATYKLKDGKRRTRKTRQLDLRIGMTDLEPLQQWRQDMGVGNITGPYYKKQYKPFWTLSVRGRDKIVDAYEKMWDWLSPRRKQKYIELMGRTLRCLP